MAPPLLARLIRFGGGKLLDRAVAKVVPAAKSASQGAAKGGLSKGLAGAAMTRIATRSVPGAILVGGGMLAKMLYDRRHAQAAAMPVDEDSDAIG